MNKQQREEIQSLIDKLTDIKERLAEMLTEEFDKADNMPENLQDSESVNSMRDDASVLCESSDEIDEVILELLKLL